MAVRDIQQRAAKTLGPRLDQPQAAAVAAELARLLESEPFQGSARQRKFLSVIVDWTLRGKADEIKETTLALMVFGRHPSSFDAQRDPVVRMEAARIRKNLERYYAGAGVASRLRIDIPKGHYRPIFLDSASSEPAVHAIGTNALTSRAGSIGSAAKRPRIGTADSKARDCFYRGQYALQQRDSAMHTKATELFRKAIAVDPNFAQAYASLAMTLLSIAGFVSSPSGPLVTEAVAAARHAIAMDAGTADAYVALGAIAHRIEWDWPEAERLYRRALELGPDSANSHASFGYALSMRGRFSEAAKHLRIAYELDPLNVGMRAACAKDLYFQRRYVEADAELTALLEIAPQHEFAEFALGFNALYSGRPQVARAAFERVSAILPDHPSPHLLIPATLALEGREREAREQLNAVLARRADQYYCRYHLAITYAYLRDRDHLYAALDQAAELSDVLLVTLPVEPAFDAYHDDLRFRTFLAAHWLPSLESCEQAA